MGQVDQITKFAPDLGAPAVSPVARHVALMRQEWREKLREYREAEDAEIGRLPEAEQDAAFDRAGKALNELVGVRAADLHILAEKMRIIDTTGTYQADGYWEELAADVDELSHRAVFVPTKTDIFAAVKRGLKKLEPWFDWGRCERARLDSKCAHFTDESWGQVYRFDLQWFGVHFAIELGRTPAKVSAAESAARLSKYRDLTSVAPVPDADFWQAHRKWAQVRADWNADKDPDEDAVFKRWNDVETDAFKAMILIPVGTASAIIAKQIAAHFDNVLPESFALEAIEADLFALAAKRGEA